MSSKDIDEKVVSMKFDNSNFESNVKTTMSTLDKLKAALNFKGASSGLEQVASSVSNVNLNGLLTGVENLDRRFSLFGVSAMTIVQDITRSIENFGAATVRAFTIDPVKTGFEEYELKMNSVQTIMASTGESIDVVNSYLDELNAYSDRTIYSFQDMTSNIGKFTNAGVKLEDAVIAMKGISNEAAISGANANEASRAMYNLSQALSMGYVQYIDWKSIENANMATVEFKKNLADIAVQYGTVTKVGEDAFQVAGKNYNLQALFKDAMKDQWLTSEVLIQTLKNYADETTDIGQRAYEAATKVKTFSMLMDTLKEAAQSGWAQSWETIIGNLVEARELWTELSDKFGGAIGEAAMKRNERLAGALDSSWAKVSKQLNEAGISASELEEELRKASPSAAKAIEQAGSLDKALQQGLIGKDSIVNIIKKMASELDGLGTSTTEANDKFEEMQKLVAEIWSGDWGNGQARVEALTKANYDYNAVQKLIEKTEGGRKLTLEDLDDEMLESIGYTDEQVEKLHELAAACDDPNTEIGKLLSQLEKPSGRTLLIDSLRNSIEAISRIMNAFKMGWEQVFPPDDDGERLYGVIEKVHEFTESLIVSSDTVEKLSHAFKGLFAIVDIVRRIGFGGLSTALKLVNMFLGMFGTSILDVLAFIGDSVDKFRVFIFENNRLADAIKTLLYPIVYLVESLYNWISANVSLEGVLTSVSNGATYLSGKVRSLYTSIKASPKTATLVQTFWEFCNKIESFLRSQAGNVKEFISDLRSLDKITFKSVGDALSKFFGKFTSGLPSIEEVFSNLKNSIKDLCSGAVEWIKNKVPFAEEVIGVVEGIISKIKSIFSSFTLADLGVIVFGAAILKIIKTLTSLIKFVGELLKGVVGILGELSAAAKQLTKYLKSQTIKVYTEAMLTVALGILALSAAMYILAAADTGKLYKSLGALAVVTAIIVGLLVLVFKLSKDNDVKDTMSASALFASLAILLGVMTALVLVLNKMTPGELKNGYANVMALMLLVTSMFAMMGAIRKATNTDFASVSKALISMALSMAIMAGIVFLLGNMNPSSAIRGIGLLTVLMIEFGWLMAAYAGLSAIVPEWGSIGREFILMATAMAIMAGIIYVIGSMKPEKAAMGVVALTAVMIAMVALMGIIKLMGKDVQAVGKTIALVSVGLLAISVAMAILGRMDASSLGKALVAVTILMAIFVVVIKLLKGIEGQNMGQAGVMLMGMGVALMAISLCCAILSHIEFKNLMKAVFAISILLIVMGLTAKLANGMKATKNGIKYLIVLVAAIGVLAIAIGILSALNWQGVLSASVGLAAVVGMMALLVYSTKFAGNAATSAVVLAALIFIVAVALKELANLPVTGLISAAGSLAIVILALSGSIIALGNLMSRGSLLTALAAAGIMAGLLVVVSLCMYYLTKNIQNGDEAIKIALSLAILFGTLTLVVAVLSALGIAAVSALAGMVIIAVLIAGIVGLGYLFQEVEGIEGYLDKGIEIIQKIAGGLGAALGAFVTSFLAVASIGLAACAASFNLFMTLMKPVFADLRELGGDSAVVDGAIKLAELMVMLGASELIGALTSFVTGFKDSDKFVERIGSFMKSIKGLCDELDKAELDEDKVRQVNTIAEIMVALSKSIPNEGGLLGAIMGENNIDEWAEKLPAFATAMGKFGFELGKWDKYISQDKVKNISTCAEFMIALSKEIPNSGGLLGDIVGNNDIDKWAERLPAFATAMGEFGKAIGENEQYINEDKIKNIKTCAKYMIALSESVPNSGGLIGLLTGDNNIDEWANRLPLFATAMGQFGMTLDTYSSYINADRVQKVVDCCSMLVALENGLGTDSSIIDFFTGKEGLDDFAEKIKSFGEGVGAFFESVSGIGDGTEANAAISVATKLATFARMLGDGADISQGLEVLGNFELYSMQFESFAKAITALSSNIGEIDQSKIDTACIAASSISTMLSSFSPIAFGIFTTEGFDSFIDKAAAFGSAIKTFGIRVNGLNLQAITDACSAYDRLISLAKHATGVDFGSLTNMSEAVAGMSDNAGAMSAAADSMASAASNAVEQFNNAINANLGSVTSAGTSMINSFVKGFGNTAIVRSAANKVVRAAVNAFASASAYSEGVSFARTFINGISGQSFNAGVAASSLALSASSNLSFDSYSIGQNIGQGLANGMLDKKSVVDAAAADLAAAAEKAIKLAAQVKSPSRVTKRIGQFIAMGLAVGMEDGTDSIINSASLMTNRVMDAISNVSDTIKNSILPTDDFVITPILDLSEVSTGARQLSNMLSFGATARVSNGLSAMYGYHNNQNGQYDDLGNKIDGLKDAIKDINSTTYTINGVTYDDGSNIANAVRDITNAVILEGRI